jgi:hypothetical protein
MTFATNFKHEQPSRVDEKIDRVSKKAAALREVHKAVDLRDKRRCRAYGVRVNPTASSLLERGHRHHIRFRSQGGQDTTENLITLSARAHADIHAGKLHILSDNADRKVTFEKDGIQWQG